MLFNSNIITKTSLNIGFCELWPLPNFEDIRGDLMVTEFSNDLPFQPQRLFIVHSVPNSKLRGEHAHKACHQFLIAIRGEIKVIVDDGENKAEICLDRPSIGLYMPANIWGVQHSFSKGSMLLVYASHPYDPDDYIRDYGEFKDYVRRSN